MKEGEVDGSIGIVEVMVTGWEVAVEMLCAEWAVETTSSSFESSELGPSGGISEMVGRGI